MAGFLYRQRLFSIFRAIDPPVKSALTVHSVCEGLRQPTRSIRIHGKTRGPPVFMRWVGHRRPGFCVSGVTDRTSRLFYRCLTFGE